MEQALEEDNRSLKTQLEEARRGASRLGQERDELSRRLEEREREREALRRGKTDLEEQKRLLDRALEKINKEVCVCVCRVCVREGLQCVLFSQQYAQFVMFIMLLLFFIYSFHCFFPFVVSPVLSVFFSPLLFPHLHFSWCSWCCILFLIVFFKGLCFYKMLSTYLFLDGISRVKP